MPCHEWVGHKCHSPCYKRSQTIGNCSLTQTLKVSTLKGFHFGWFSHSKLKKNLRTFLLTFCSIRLGVLSVAAHYVRGSDESVQPPPLVWILCGSTSLLSNFSRHEAPDMTIVKILISWKTSQNNSFFDVKLIFPVTIELRFHFPLSCPRNI